MEYECNLNIQVFGSWVWGQPGLHNKSQFSLLYTAKLCLKRLRVMLYNSVVKWFLCTKTWATFLIPATSMPSNWLFLLSALTELTETHYLVAFLTIGFCMFQLYYSKDYHLSLQRPLHFSSLSNSFSYFISCSWNCDIRNWHPVLCLNVGKPAVWQ